MPVGAVEEADPVVEEALVEADPVVEEALVEEEAAWSRRATVTNIH